MAEEAPAELEALIDWARASKCLVQLVSDHLVCFPPPPRGSTGKVVWVLEPGDSFLDALAQVLARAKQEHAIFEIEVRNLQEQREAERKQRAKGRP